MKLDCHKLSKILSLRSGKYKIHTTAVTSHCNSSAEAVESGRTWAQQFKKRFIKE